MAHISHQSTNIFSSTFSSLSQTSYYRILILYQPRSKNAWVIRPECALVRMYTVDRLEASRYASHQAHSHLQEVSSETQQTRKGSARGSHLVGGASEDGQLAGCGRGCTSAAADWGRSNTSWSRDGAVDVDGAADWRWGRGTDAGRGSRGSRDGSCAGAWDYWYWSRAGAWDNWGSGGSGHNWSRSDGSWDDWGWDAGWGRRNNWDGGRTKAC